MTLSKASSTQSRDSQLQILQQLREENERLEAEKQAHYRQISNLKLCLTILHGQGLEQKKALKAERNALVEQKNTLRKTLSIEREFNDNCYQVASYWTTFVNDDDDDVEAPDVVVPPPPKVFTKTANTNEAKAKMIVEENESIHESSKSLLVLQAEQQMMQQQQQVIDDRDRCSSDRKMVHSDRKENEKEEKEEEIEDHGSGSRGGRRGHGEIKKIDGKDAAFAADAAI